MTYDDDGNLTQALPGDGSGGLVQCDLKWDAENRLIEVTPVSPVSGSKKVFYDYDYLGRRVQRTVHSCYDPETLPGAACDPRLR